MASRTSTAPIFALPEQSLENGRALHAACLQTDQVSAYALTYEEDTPFFEKLQRGDWRRTRNGRSAMFEGRGRVLGRRG